MTINQDQKVQNEEAPANSAGAGGIAGIGISNSEKGENFGEPGRKKKDQPLILRRQIWVRKNKNG
jgi:hypothetical protein